jgi:hypothetical protein
MPDGTGNILTRIFRDTRAHALDSVTVGSIFRRTHADVVETAKVLSVSPDSFGIPHVRYNVSFQRRTRGVTTEGQRVLSLRTFAERYTERCVTP